MVSTTSKRRSSNLPARSRSYRTSDVVVVDDDNNDDNNGNSECTEKISSAMDTLSGIAWFLSLILTFIVKDYKIAFLSAFVIASFKTLVLILIDIGRTRTW